MDFNPWRLKKTQRPQNGSFDQKIFTIYKFRQKTRRIKRFMIHCDDTMALMMKWIRYLQRHLYTKSCMRAKQPSLRLHFVCGAPMQNMFCMPGVKTPGLGYRPFRTGEQS
jgi:hypothetical protein